MLSFICVHEDFVREHVLPAKGDDFMELKPIGVSNRLFYYLNGGENSAFDACFRFDFKEETQEELLSAAIAKALQSFPEFAFRPVLHEGSVWAAKNEAPVPLLSAAVLSGQSIDNEKAAGGLRSMSLSYDYTVVFALHYIGLC